MLARVMQSLFVPGVATQVETNFGSSPRTLNTARSRRRRRRVGQVSVLPRLLDRGQEILQIRGQVAHVLVKRLGRDEFEFCAGSDWTLKLDVRRLIQGPLAA